MIRSNRKLLPAIRHPEVRAERASKDVAAAPGPSPFEGRFAATSATVFFVKRAAIVFAP
jgi:hypothetical protein